MCKVYPAPFVVFLDKNFNDKVKVGIYDEDLEIDFSQIELE